MTDTMIPPRAVLISLCVSLILPAILIIIGGMNINNCPVQPKIPVMLIVVGTIFALQAVWDIVRQMSDDGFEKRYVTGHLVLGLAGMASLIAASIFVYRVGNEYSTDPKAPNYCNGTTFQVAFWGLTTIWVALIIIGCCCGGSHYHKRSDYNTNA